MKIEIEIPEWKCDNLLRAKGFVTEDVVAYYNNDENPYNDEIHVVNLKPITIRIAYHKNTRPMELRKEFPMLHVLEEFKYEKVVNSLFNEALWNIIAKPQIS